MRQTARRQRRDRRGAVVVLVALLLVPICGMVAFAIDIGYILLVKTELQAAADAAALAGASQLVTNTPTDSPFYSDTVAKNVMESDAATEAKKYAALNTSKGVDSLYLADNDMAFTFGTDLAPGNVEVTLRRDAANNPSVALFFAPIFGMSNTNSTVVAAAQVAEASTGYFPAADLLPFAIKRDVFLDGIGGGTSGLAEVGDSFEDDGSLGPDGIWEIKLFPGGGSSSSDDGTTKGKSGGSTGSDSLTSGNWGSIDIGSASNGTPELEQQILYGPTEDDFDIMGVTGDVLSVPFTTGGDTGISAAVENEFDQIIGQRRVIALYDSLSGTGNTAEFGIVGFAGVVVVDVQLTGGDKYVKVQSTFLMPTSVKAGSGTNLKVEDFEGTRLYESVHLTK